MAKKAQPVSASESKALHPGLLGPREQSRLPNLFSSPAASNASSDQRTWGLWVPTFPGWEGPGTFSLHSQQVIFCKFFFLCRLHSFLYSASCWHLEVGEGNFTMKMCCCLYLLLPFYWQSEAVRNTLSASPGGEISPQTRVLLQTFCASTLYQTVDSGNSKSIICVSKHGVQTLL